MEWMLELVLVVMLATTLFHAVRLERALGVLKRDRATLEALVAGFNDSTRQAEQGIERLRATADGTGRQIAHQAEAATALKNDLAYLIERGDKIADRLDSLIRTARPLAAEAPAPMLSPALAVGAPAGAGMAPRMAPGVSAGVPSGMAMASSLAGSADAADTRLRSQAERDLLKALRMAR